MKKHKPVMLTAIVFAIILLIASYWVPHMDWAFLPYVILAGCFMVWVQKETMSYKFLDKLLAGSVLFGFSFTLFTFFRMYALTNLVYDTPPLPLRELWSQGPLVLTGAYVFLAFLGGLFGIFLKGLYSIYKQKLDWVIICAGPLFATLASLAVFKIKVGGTVMSGYHGLPYSYFTHQTKDVVDGFSIDTWIFSPGSMYQYVILNYVMYLAVFVLGYCLIQVINKKLKTKRLNRTYILFGILLIMIVGFMSFLPAKRSYINHHIAQAGYCEDTPDCVIVGNASPFSCAIVTNKESAESITKLVRSYPSIGTLSCSGDEQPVCIQNKCRVAFDHTPNETSWEMLKRAVAECQVISIMQTHALDVSAVLKNGKIINAKEPRIDDIFDFADQYRDKCGEIRMATE